MANSGEESEKLIRQDVSFLRHEFYNYLQTSELTDVMLICDDGLVRVHRFILASISPMLSKCLVSISTDDESSATVMLPGHFVDNVKLFFAHIYGLEHDDQTQNISNQEMELADTLNINFYKLDFKNHISPENVFFIKPEIDCDAITCQDDADEEYYDAPDLQMNYENLTSSSPPLPSLSVSTSDANTFLSSYPASIYQGRKHNRTTKRSVRVIDSQQLANIYIERRVEDDQTNTEEFTPVKQRKRRILAPASIGGWNCSECNQVLSSAVKLSEHVKEVHQEGLLQHLAPGKGDYCAPCKMTFPNGLSEFKAHLLDDCCVNRIGGGSVRVYICDPCPLVFYSGQAFDRHMVQHKEIWSCRVCNETFMESEVYFKHMSENHRNFIERSFKCHICPRAFTMEFKLIRHLDIHANGQSAADIEAYRKSNSISFKATYKIIHCQHCNKEFTNRRNLNSHLKTHKEASFCCPRCPRKFKSKRGLGYHIKMHDGRTEFLCDDCGRGFVCRQKLQLHRRSKHTFEKPYICDQCGVSFIRSENLTVHRRRAHTGEKPYSCSHCDWVGVDSSSLCHHRKKHQIVLP